tara:strand:+ start:259 stop:408 length:150 start_codon:yes stop_codon:yes gene_type:complete
MSLPSVAQSAIEDLFEEEMDRLLTLGYDVEKAALLAEQEVLMEYQRNGT